MPNMIAPIPSDCKRSFCDSGQKHQLPNWCNLANKQTHQCVVHYPAIFHCLAENGARLTLVSANAEHLVHSCAFVLFVDGI